MRLFRHLGMLFLFAMVPSLVRAEPLNLKLHVLVDEAVSVSSELDSVTRKALEDINRELRFLNIELASYQVVPNFERLEVAPFVMEDSSDFIDRFYNEVLTKLPGVDVNGDDLYYFFAEPSYTVHGFPMWTGSAGAHCGKAHGRPVAFSSAVLEPYKMHYDVETETDISRRGLVEMVKHELLHLLGAHHSETILCGKRYRPARYRKKEVRPMRLNRNCVFVERNVMVASTTIPWIGPEPRNFPVLRKTKREVRRCVLSNYGS